MGGLAITAFTILLEDGTMTLTGNTSKPTKGNSSVNIMIPKR